MKEHIVFKTSSPLQLFLNRVASPTQNQIFEQYRCIYDCVLVVTASEKDPVYFSDDPKTTIVNRSRRDGRLRL